MVRYGHVLRVALAFGFFQFIMPVIGWFAGSTFSAWCRRSTTGSPSACSSIIGGQDDLGVVPRRLRRPAKDPTRGWNLLVLAVATSIDALAVGLSLAFLDTSIWYPAVVIGIVAAVLSAVGALFGCRLGHRFGVWAERAGGWCSSASGSGSSCST